MILLGCSSFRPKWQEATSVAPPNNSIEGPWKGRWTSDVNGHTGLLRCVIERETEAVYRAQFHAVYWRVLRFGYAVVLHGEKRDGALPVHFSGTADLGWWAGGEYKYEGWATAEAFRATYRSKHDHGTFMMTRPAVNAD